MAPVKQFNEQVIDGMFELEERYRAILEERAQNRTLARAMLASGVLNAEQAQAVRETYPERQSRATVDDES